MKIALRLSELRVPLKMTFRHAAAERTHGDSVWVEASRGEHRGYGEGCPRSYVTGETRDSCREWIGAWQAPIVEACDSLEALEAFVREHEEAIDESPSMWCAIECALLDLFARERGQSVEAMLGLAAPGGPHCYTAVLGNDEPWKTRFLIDQYLILGLRDFKVKLEGNLQADRSKLESIDEITAAHGVEGYRVRADANNLWAARPDEAIGYLSELGGGLAAIEEPVAPRDAVRHSGIGTTLDCPVILDESLRTPGDLSLYDGLPGRFIANLKVSRIGGILRGLRLAKALRERNWPIIVGAHVGETSVLTRAGMLIASAAGDRLFAQEGAFGSRLVEREPAQPCLRWGRGGFLDLRRLYAEATSEGMKITQPENWTSSGWGLDGRFPNATWKATEDVGVETMSDGYVIHYRRWGPARGGDAILILHGGMSHSLWQRPLAQAIRAEEPAMTVIAPDRRGCGLNAGRGDLVSAERTIADVEEHVRALARRFDRVHLAGWCQGAQYAAVVAERMQGDLASVLLITPGLFWNARFRSVIDMTERVVHSLLTHFSLAPDRGEAFVPIPLQAGDFTQSPAGLDFIDADDLKTTEVTLKSVVVMDEVQERSWEAVLRVRVPLFAVTATRDRIVDNHKVRTFMAPVLEAEGNRWMEIDAGHAVQFEQAEALARAMIGFIRLRVAGLVGAR
ncbi:MAG: alpha/beta fold hydrolase [Bryobacteraceae bacterium]